MTVGPLHVVHVVGDSHTRVFFGQTNRSPAPAATVHVTGTGAFVTIDVVHGELAGATMRDFGVPDPGIPTRERLATFLSERRENVALMFGEVDIRWHAHRESRRDGRSVEDTIASYVKSYEAFIRDAIAPVVVDRLIVFGGVPYSRAYCKAVAKADGELNAHARELDRQLREMCQRNRWWCLTVFDALVDADGFLRDDLTCRDEPSDTVHIEPSVGVGLVVAGLERIFGAAR